MHWKLLPIYRLTEADVSVYSATVLMKAGLTVGLHTPLPMTTHAGEQIRDARILVVHTCIPCHSCRESLLLLHITYSVLWTYDLHLAHLA